MVEEVSVKFRKLRNNTYQAIVTDETGKRWIWMKPIGKRIAEFQGSMGMLGATHKSTVFGIHGWGDESVSDLKYGGERVKEYIKERFFNYSDEFEPYYSVKKR